VATDRLGVDLYDALATPVFEEQWDLLVVLDACRVDLMRETAPEYDVIDTVGTRWSVSGESRGWIETTFKSERAEEWAAETGYVSGNPYSERTLSESDVGYLDRVIADSFDHDRGVMPARPITDRAIWAGRRREQLGISRLVVHYMQPHFPAVDHLDLGAEMHPHDDSKAWLSVWDRLADGDPEIHRSDVLTAYWDNLRYVLEDVSLLLSNVDAETAVVTADHGNALGEWGFFGHGDHPVPGVRRVPWCVTSARDSGERCPAHGPPETDDGPLDSGETADRLRALGYRE
jgi:hypothetical protein